MSDMKCPFCKQELEYLAEDIYGGMYCPICGKGDLFGNEKMWKELIRTRKALDVAVDALDRMAIHDSIYDIIARNAMKKINELVDAVNELQTKAEILEENAHTTAKVDPYAEQCKWIGKLCKFWDNSDKPEDCVYDILCNIFDSSHHEDCPFQCGNGEWYEYCEPVKPDDDIIYKGK